MANIFRKLPVRFEMKQPKKEKQKECKNEKRTN